VGSKSSSNALDGTNRCWEVYNCTCFILLHLLTIAFSKKRFTLRRYMSDSRPEADAVPVNAAGTTSLADSDAFSVALGASSGPEQLMKVRPISEVRNSSKAFPTMIMSKLQYIIWQECWILQVLKDFQTNHHWTSRATASCHSFTGTFGCRRRRCCRLLVGQLGKKEHGDAQQKNSSHDHWNSLSPWLGRHLHCSP